MADRWDLTGWEATAAADLVRLIEARLPEEWTPFQDGPGMWPRWELIDGDVGRLIVAVNGREDRVLVPVHAWPAKVGPTVMAARWGDQFVSVTLPAMSDRSDMRGALDILAHVVPALRATDGRA